MAPETITHGAVLAIGVILGVGFLAAVQWARRESAFTRRFGEDLATTLGRFGNRAGVAVGVVENVPPHMESPPWWRGLPAPPEPAEHRPALEPWPVNSDTGRHRRVRPRRDDTQQFTPIDVLDAAGAEVSA